MFVTELTFLDADAPSELVLVRRPLFVLGADTSAHLVVDDTSNLPFDILVARDLGRSFRCKAVNIRGSLHDVPSFLQESDRLFEEELKFVIGRIKVHLFSLDSDLLPQKDEGLDVAGVRLVLRALATRSPYFPALEVTGAVGQFTFSFQPDTRLGIGRGPDSDVRIDVPEVSSQHARLGFDGKSFWIEDVGSTNGTYIGESQVSGRTSVEVNQLIVLSRNTVLVGRLGAEEVDKFSDLPENESGYSSTDEYQVVPVVSSKEAVGFRSWGTESAPDDGDAIEPSFSSRALAGVNAGLNTSYPALVSLSEVVRPARVQLHPGVEVRIGRDPASDLWVGAPHVSRLHCVLMARDDHLLTVVDKSTNGTFHEFGVIEPGMELIVDGRAKVLNFGSTITVAICFSEEDERLFSSTKGSPFSFVKSKEGEVRSSGGEFPNASPQSYRRSSGVMATRSSVGGSPGRLRSFFVALRQAGTPMLVLVLVSSCFLVVLIIGLLREVFL